MRLARTDEADPIADVFLPSFRGLTFVPMRRFYERNGCRVVELTDGSGNEEREPDALYEWAPSDLTPGTS